MIEGRVDLQVLEAMFPEKASKANAHRYFPLVRFALERFHIHRPELQLVAYATIRAESAGFRPLTEFRSRYNTIRIPLELNPHQGGRTDYSRYEFRRNLGNTRPGDGSRFIGRGFIQLTGRANYTRYGQRIGMPQLVDEPELANRAEVAALVLAAYIDEHRARITAALARGDLKAVRRSVNGGSHGLAAFEQAYRAGLARVRRATRDVPGPDLSQTA